MEHSQSKYACSLRGSSLLRLLLLCVVSGIFVLQINVKTSSSSSPSTSSFRRAVAVVPIQHTDNFFFQLDRPATGAAPLTFQRITRKNATLLEEHHGPSKLPHRWNFFMNCPSNPAAFDPRKPIPLVVFLHGAGEASVDPQVMLDAIGAAGSLPQIVTRHNVLDEDSRWDAASADPQTHPLLNGQFPALVVAPQSIHGWPFDLLGIRAVQHLVVELVTGPVARTFLRDECGAVIDRQRVVVTGASQGGYAAMEMLVVDEQNTSTSSLHQPPPPPPVKFFETVTHVASLSGFSASAPRTGKGLVETLHAHRHIRLLLVHGLHDGNVPSDATKEIVHEMQKEQLVSKTSSDAWLRETTVAAADKIHWDDGGRPKVLVVWLEQANSAPDAPGTEHSTIRDVFAAQSPFWAWIMSE